MKVSKMIIYPNKYVEEAVYEYLNYGFPRTSRGLSNVISLLYFLDQYMTLLTVDCYVVDIEATIESIRNDIKRSYKECFQIVLKVDF